VKTLTQNIEMEAPIDWFSSWFDSPYYHILYKNRDFREAQMFVEKLAQFLDFQPQHKILDLACGKGRHAINLNQKGLEVVGADLSPESITYAQQFTNSRLRFYVHDMRQSLPENDFDFVLNLFTSFGYFESADDNLQVIQSITQGLKPQGRLVIDFLNPHKVVQTMLPFESKTVEGINFLITKQLENDFIVKTIEFTDQGKKFEFQERVKAIMPDEFLTYFAQSGLTLRHLFGNYQLENFDLINSDRMILIAERG
jgi:SAM-dependent methyltransferase